MNTQNEDINDTDSDLVKDKYRTRPREATEDNQKGEKSIKIRTDLSFSEGLN